GVDGDLLQLGFDVGRDVLLVAAVEVFGEELLHGGYHGEVVDGTGEAMAFVGSDEVFDRFAVVTDGGDDLAALADVDAGIVFALHDHQRGDDVLGLGEGRLGDEEGLAVRGGGVGHAGVHLFAARLPVGRDGVEQGDEIGRSDDGDRCGVDVRGEGDAGQGCVAAVGAAGDSDAPGVGGTVGYEGFDAPGDVVLHLAAPLAVAGVEELLAVTGGSPK